MEQKFHTSFIPKKSLSSIAGKRPRRGTINIFFLGALIIFLGALLLAVGIFLYQQFLTSSIERKSTSLERARAEFEPTFIQEISRLDARMDSASDILGNHVALSALFELLESTTLKTIAFKDFSFRVSSDGNVSIFMQGNARSFSSIALQSDIFGSNKFIQEPIFSNLDLDKTGNALFDFAAFVDPGLISFAASSAQGQLPGGTVNSIPQN